MSPPAARLACRRPRPRSRPPPPRSTRICARPTPRPSPSASSRFGRTAASTGATPASARAAYSRSQRSAPARRSPPATGLAPAPTRNRSADVRAAVRLKGRSIMTSAVRVFAALALLAVFAPAAQAMEFSPWAPAVNAEDVPGTSGEFNTAFQDGCPIQAPDGLSLFMASTRPRFDGDTRTDIDIWVAERESKDAPWGAPQNLGAPVNSTADDFCPTPIRGEGLFFVSRRVLPGVTCGMGTGDIYLTRLNPGQGWEVPEHLGCAADGGPNTPLDEQG